MKDLLLFCLSCRLNVKDLLFNFFIQHGNKDVWKVVDFKN